LLQPTNRTHSISDQVIEQIGNVILSGRLKPGDKVASEKKLMSEFGDSEESLTSILIVKSENLIKGEEIRYGN
jgi:GntR family transcriptional repressor for pyruvate dehydrogenase complex